VTLRLAGRIAVGAFSVEMDLVVEPGETVALVGPNGAGKSTVLRALAGLHPLSTGTMRFGAAVWDDPVAGVFVPPAGRGVGVVFQEYLLFDHLSALDNVAFGLRARGVARRDAERRSSSLLEVLGVGDVAGRRPPELSGGQAQRVALARALVVEPDLLLLDEPLAALDVGARAAVRHDLRRMMDGVAGCRVVVSHDPVDAHEIADRVVVLERGAVTQVGTFDEIAASPRSTYAAELMGTNVLAGHLDGHEVTLSGPVPLRVGAHDLADGPVLVAIRPMAIALHHDRPEGSPRNVWRTTVASLDRYHERVRVRLGDELPVVVELTEAGWSALGLGRGGAVWASVKASEVAVVSDS
jgi:molybdate transport system ATP-binding protein